ncbi:MAG: hypothetical protein KGI89_16195 [Euryarchaeota archaeon]|nr:hypothetical protein [Euryarchaeota archaeon]MDE2044351.1 hypothetical protein [Thermoplasmata archaeon]
MARDVGRERYVVDFDSGGSPSLRPPARLAEQLADHREAPAVGDGGEGTPIREN